MNLLWTPQKLASLCALRAQIPTETATGATRSSEPGEHRTPHMLMVKPSRVLQQRVVRERTPGRSCPHTLAGGLSAWSGWSYIQQTLHAWMVKPETGNRTPETAILTPRTETRMHCSQAAVERFRHTSNSQDQMLVLAFR